MEFSLQSSTAVSISMEVTQKQTKVARPTWDTHKVYPYLEDLGEAFLRYKAKASAYYRSDFAARGLDRPLTIKELKETIAAYFPEYSFTEHEPRDVVPGKFYLYIDDTQLAKLAEEPGYRARVFGLMDSELQGSKGFTLQHSSGKAVTHHLTGSIFSLAEANRSLDGVGSMPGSEQIPYSGSARGDASCSTDGPVRVRSASYIEQLLHPGRSASLRAAGSLPGTLTGEERARRSQEEHKLRIELCYEQWREAKTEADALEERFLTDLRLPASIETI